MLDVYQYIGGNNSFRYSTHTANYTDDFLWKHGCDSVEGHFRWILKTALRCAERYQYDQALKLHRELRKTLTEHQKQWLARTYGGSCLITRDKLITYRYYFHEKKQPVRKPRTKKYTLEEYREAVKRSKL